MHFRIFQCKQKGSVLPFVILLALVIVGIVLVYRYFFNETSSIGSTKIVSKVNSDNKEKTKIYKNNNLNFEFKYEDKDLVVKEDSEEGFNKRGGGDFRKNFKGYAGYEPGKFLGAMVVLDKSNDFDKNPFTVWIFDNQDNETIDSWFAKYWYYPFVWGVFDFTSKGHIIPDSEATISGQQAKYKIIFYQPGEPKFVYISKDQKMYLFRIIGETGEQTLATFKFLEIDSDRGVCIQVITSAKDSKSGQCKDFPTPCDVPENWQKVESCKSQ